MAEGGARSGVRSWVCGSLIGAGAFGSVNLAVDNETGELFAVKSTECSPRARSEIQALENELTILQSLSSPRVVKCLGSGWSTSAETGNPVRNVFLEYMPGGSLCDLMAKLGGKLHESLARIYTRGILEGLEFLHSNGIVHCDIKGKNVLVGSSGGVKLADFGAAKRVSSSQHQVVSIIKGTPLWMAPEVVRQEEQGPASDIWSLGCTVLEMITGKAPWGDASHNTFSALYRIGCSEELPDFPAGLSQQAIDFLNKCLLRDPTRRWTSSQLLNHPFVTEQLQVEAIGAPDHPKYDFAHRGVCSWQDSGEISQFLGEIPVHCSQQLVRPRLEVPSWPCEDLSEPSSSSPASGKWIVVRSPSSACSNEAFNLLSDFGSDEETECPGSRCDSSDSSDQVTTSFGWDSPTPTCSVFWVETEDSQRHPDADVGEELEEEEGAEVVQVEASWGCSQGGAESPEQGSWDEDKRCGDCGLVSRLGSLKPVWKWCWRRRRGIWRWICEQHHHEAWNHRSDRLVCESLLLHVHDLLKCVECKNSRAIFLFHCLIPDIFNKPLSNQSLVWLLHLLPPRAAQIVPYFCHSWAN